MQAWTTRSPERPHWNNKLPGRLHLRVGARLDLLDLGIGQMIKASVMAISSVALLPGKRGAPVQKFCSLCWCLGLSGVLSFTLGLLAFWEAFCVHWPPSISFNMALLLRHSPLFLCILDSIKDGRRCSLLLRQLQK